MIVCGGAAGALLAPVDPASAQNDDAPGDLASRIATVPVDELGAIYEEVTSALPEGRVMDAKAGGAPLDPDLMRLAVRWASDAPEAGAEFLLRAGDRRVFAFLVSEWAKAGDAEKAVAYVLGLRDSGTRDMAAAPLVEAIGPRDPKLAGKALGSISDSSLGLAIAAAAEVGKHLADTETPEVGLGWLSIHASRAVEAGAAPLVLDHIADRSLAKALELAPELDDVGGVIAGRWKPKPSRYGDALQAALHGPPSQYSEHLMLVILREWTKLDYQAALEAVESLDAGGLQAQFRDQFNAVLIKARPREAFALAVENHGDPGAIDPAAAATAMVRADPHDAVDALANVSAAHPALAESTAAAAKAWAGIDAADAAAWAEKLERPETRAAAFEEIVYVWSEDDSHRAADWTLAQPEDAARDGALRALVFQAAPLVPDLAIQWAAAVSDPNLRETCLATVLHLWSQDRAEEAAAALAEIENLDPEVRARLREITEAP